jgi:undecaprenyl-diphosphatase
MAIEVLTASRGPVFDLAHSHADAETRSRPGASDVTKCEATSEAYGYAKRLEGIELPIVRAATWTARPRAMRALAVMLSKLGNGWIYLLLGGLILASWRLSGIRIILLASVNALLLHSVYPKLKRVFGRLRPFQADPRLRSLLRTLDAHSFPSGHTMTLAGVLTPIVMLWPGASLPAAVVGVGLAWSRVATAHHYPTDVLAGAALGVGVGYPTTSLLVSLWG